MFTKGEWEVKDRWNVMMGRRLVANCGGYHSNVEPVAEENEANARLIAQAPKLYKFAKSVLSYLEKRPAKSFELQTMLDLAQYVLAKVEEK